MLTITKDYFSAAQIADSGQCFRFTKTQDGGFRVIAGGKYLELTQDGSNITFDCSREEFEAYWEDYFDLKADYRKYVCRISQDDLYLSRAVAFGGGIRILRQELFETTISFIVSQQNNIRRIRKIIELLCSHFGEKRYYKENKSYYAFPSPQALADASLEELAACNLGYRARYVRDTARIICGGMDLEALRHIEYIQAKAELMKLPGIGKKVADCICLFGLHQLDAFPEDTHILKVLEQSYPGGFPFAKYSGCAGVMQQYIFYYDLNGSVLERV